MSTGIRIASALSVLLTSCLVTGAEPDASTGQTVYQRQCADCHGETGQGTDDQGTGRLIGDKSLPQLIDYIEDSMPEGSPEECAGDSAREVASYVYDQFYSSAARAKRAPARLDLVRLTVRQYRNSVADLIGSFRKPVRLAAQRGLNGKYFNKNSPGGKAIRTSSDATIDFHFGPENLPPEPLDPIKGFAARWDGSIIAPDSGEYTIVVQTNQAIRLWLNDSRQPLIDAWVQSGDQTRHAASVYLLGGRAYPVRLEFTSRQQGVEDRKKYEQKPQDMFLALRWESPGSVEQVIPERCLVPQRFPKLFVVTAPFPPDDRSHGYLRGISASQSWDNATTAAAIEAAGFVVDHLAELSNVPDDANDREGKLKEFCRQFVTRAFRRPLSEEIAMNYVDERFRDAPDLESAVKRVVLMALKSPRMLYLDYHSRQVDAFDAASTLSFALWDSIPDKPLWEAAAANQLSSRAALEEQAKRMVDDPRARAKLRHFLHAWLQLDHGRDLAKNTTTYPGFDQQLTADLRSSLDLFLEDTVWCDDGDYRQLLNSRHLYLNGRLAQFYGYDLPPDAPFQKVAAKSDQRMGVISHPYMMAALAYNDFSSPIHRGVFLIRNVLGRTLRPPPAAFAPVSPDLHPDMTTRQRVTMQTQPDTCQACHGMINPIGFTLEHFDAVGRFRESENGQPIDATGVYQLANGEIKTFQNARQLAVFLVTNEQSHQAFALQLFNYLLKQPVRAFGEGMEDQITQAFTAREYSVPDLMTEVATQASLAMLTRIRAKLLLEKQQSGNRSGQTVAQTD